MSSSGPLAGLRVLDLSRLLPGPYASLALADLGADVVKVEDPQGGDYLRWMPPLDDDSSALFKQLNRGKRSVALDLKSDRDRERFLALAARADVVLETFRPGVMDRLGIGWTALRTANPRLVLCSISGYGQRGPYAARAGHDLNYIALSGVLSLLGRADQAPAQPNLQIADIAGGSLFAVSGILAALLERTRTGEGRWVDVSMTEGAIATAALTLAPMFGRHEPAPLRGKGVLSGEVPAYAVYETGDGRHLAVAALEPKFWSRLCEVLDRPDLVDFGLDAGADGQHAREELQRILAAQPLSHWTEFFAAHDCCVEPVLEPRELESHPIHLERGSFLDADGRAFQRTPIRFADREDAPATSPAPALGADNEAVWNEWLGT